MSKVRTPNSRKLYLSKTNLQDTIKSDKIASSV